MKASLISKIVIGLCVLCLVAGILFIDKDEPYFGDSDKKSGKTSTNKIAVMELEGEIEASYGENFFGGEYNASALLKSLINSKKDSDIKGVIIKINSPGGTVAMSQSIYNQIMKIRQEKPVVVVLDDTAASGGYYIASAADRIIAQGGTLTGSVGVIFSFMDFHELLTNKLFVDSVVIKSGKYKDLGSPTRAITKEEKALMQDVVNDSYDQFVEAIINGRVQRNDNYSAEKTVLTESELRKYADGRIFTGRQAKKIGFVDTIGDIDTAKDTIEKMAQEKFNNNYSAKLVKYSEKSLFSEYFFNFNEYGSKTNLNLKNIIPTSMRLSRKPLYLWE